MQTLKGQGLLFAEYQVVNSEEEEVDPDAWLCPFQEIVTNDKYQRMRWVFNGC